MFAVIQTGGKQYKVATGDVIEVERTGETDDTVEFSPVLIVDDSGKALATPSDLSGATVTAKVMGSVKGPKVKVVKYRNKTGYRRHQGHRQGYSSVQISNITLP